MRYTLAIGLAALALTVSGGASAPQEGSVPFPEGYRRWTHVKTSLVGPSAPGFVRNGGYHHFYANDKAIEGYRTGTFPDGSVLVDDGLEAVEKEGVSAEGARRRVAVMLKDSRRFGQSRNWAFEVFPRDSRTGTLDDAGKAACLACHQRADRDLVYSQLRR